MERDRRRRKKRRRNRKTRRKGFVFLVLLLVVIGAAGVLKMIKATPGLFCESGNILLSDSGQKIEFPELNVSEEDVADGFYYQQLSEQEKQVYREILQGVRSMDETILLHAGENDEAGKIYEYLIYDRSELFWCDGSSKMTVYKDYTEFHPSYICTQDQRESRREQIENAAQEVLAGAQGCETEYEKIKYIFKYLVDTVDYDQNALDNQNIYSSLVGKKSVCAGYSRAAQYLLKQMGIECIYVVGTVKEQGAHAWNIVKCNDKYYQMDVTFGDPIFQENETGETLPHDLVNYEYLCCTDEEIFTDHQQDDFVPYPVCDSNDLEYYRINGLYYETFDENEIYEKMKAGIEQGQEMFAIRFSENAVYEVAKEKIIDNLIPQAAQFLVDFRQLEEVKYTYAVDDRKRIIMIFWYS